MNKETVDLLCKPINPLMLFKVDNSKITKKDKKIKHIIKKNLITLNDFEPLTEKQIEKAEKNERLKQRINKEIEKASTYMEQGHKIEELIYTMKQVMTLVYMLQKKVPNIKGDYYLLQHYFYRIYQPYLYDSRGNLNWKIWRERRAYSPETITRAYRKLVELKYITETKKTHKKRREREISMRVAMKNI